MLVIRFVLGRGVDLLSAVRILFTACETPFHAPNPVLGLTPIFGVFPIKTH